MNLHQRTDLQIVKPQYLEKLHLWVLEQLVQTHPKYFWIPHIRLDQHLLHQKILFDLRKIRFKILKKQEPTQKAIRMVPVS